MSAAWFADERLFLIRHDGKLNKIMSGKKWQREIKKNEIVYCCADIVFIIGLRQWEGAS